MKETILWQRPDLENLFEIEDSSEKGVPDPIPLNPSTGFFIGKIFC